MTKGRMEAFSDGVIAILITIMVLELKVPHGTAWSSLRPMLPEMLSYLLSFVFVGIYWNNHHHLLHTASKVSGGILWANLHLLFWLSLIPLATAWMGENHTEAAPCSAYGVVMTGAAIAYYILQEAIVAHHGPDSKLRAALGSDLKAKFSLASYAGAIGLAYASTWIAIGIYILVAGIWLVPDKRLESVIDH